MCPHKLQAATTGVIIN